MILVFSLFFWRTLTEEIVRISKEIKLCITQHYRFRGEAHLEIIGGGPHLGGKCLLFLVLFLGTIHYNPFARGPQQYR